jgi:transcription elongation factor SPT6
MLKLIKEELTHPFRDLRDERKDLQQQQIFHLLIGDENFQKGMITVAKVLRIDPEHVQCKLQNDLAAALWFNDILEDSEIEKGSKEKIKALFKPGSAFEARIKNIDYTNYKVDLMTKPSEMRTHKNYIPNVEQLSNFFELTDEDRLNIPYINAHSQKNKKYQPRNIKNDRFKNISYTDCCNYLRNKDIGECIFRPSSMGNNNITLSYKFYKQIICHLDITEEDKQPGENIGKKLKISNEVYSSLDEILKRYVIPCAQLIKESIKNRKFIHCDTKTDFENSLKEEKKKTQI